MEDIHNAENETGSPIQEFYKNKSIFITGGTGFLGKILVEKLLRSCPQVNSLYLLIRQKKSKDCQQRIQEYLEDEVFSRLDQKSRLKIIGIPGDISQPGLALSDEHTKILKENVEVVFHSAATIRFDEALPVAVAINVCGTKEMLELAGQMKNLKAYVHVSTAYSNCNLKEIDEKIYTPPTKPENLISLAKNIDNNFMDQITPILLDKWPNTYVYTKNVAEDIVKSYSKKLPICIFRPAIVVAANEEPVPGWIDNLNGVTGVMAGTGTGVLRTLNCDENVIADVVPVDMTVNALIATAWKKANRMIEDTNRNNLDTEDIPVYNYVSSVEKQIKWGELMDLSVEHGSEVPPVCAMWCYCLTLNKSWLLNKLYVIFLHFLPAIIMDRVASLFGKRTNMLSIYKKINKFADVLGFFTIRDWKFSNSNVQNLWKGLSEQDKKLFPFDMSSLDWSRFFYYYVRGVRQYILKEDISTVPQGKVRFRRFLILHKGLKLVVGFFFLRLMWSMISPLLS